MQCMLLEDELLFNLAYKKPTSQSSTGWGGLSLRAVDGRLSGRYKEYGTSCYSGK